MTAEAFVHSLCIACGVEPGDHVLAAVSGGADSVALLCLLCDVRERLGIVVSCAHVEHGIRGSASLEDMAFVGRLCAQKNVPLYSERFDVPRLAKETGRGLEETARDLRQGFLRRIAGEIGAQHIALAHHAGDQAETVLLHAARGSDIRGLCAMRFRSSDVIRPLLKQTPQALRDYLMKIGQDWREDETNLNVSYARNRIRHDAMPALLAAYPGAVEALCRLAEAAQRDESHFEALLCRLEICVTPLVDGIMLDREQLSSLDDALLSRLLDRLLAQSGAGGQSAQVIREIASLVRFKREAVVNLQGGGHALIGNEKVYLIGRQAPCDATPLALCGDTVTPFGTFSIREAGSGETGDGRTSQAFDEQALAGAVITGRQMGDRMIPFGRHTPVALKKLMIDAGVERPVRNSLPVLRRGEDILWAVGLRPSALCKAQGGRRLLVTYKSIQQNTHARCGMHMKSGGF